MSDESQACSIPREIDRSTSKPLKRKQLFIDVESASSYIKRKQKNLQKKKTVLPTGQNEIPHSCYHHSSHLCHPRWQSPTELGDLEGQRECSHGGRVGK